MKKLVYKKKEVNKRRLVNTVPMGKEFGEWTVTHMGIKPDYLFCECTCGVEREVHVYSLTSGKSVSCGCLRRRRADEGTRLSG